MACSWTRPAKFTASVSSANSAVGPNGRSSSSGLGVGVVLFLDDDPNLEGRREKVLRVVRQPECVAAVAEALCIDVEEGVVPARWAGRHELERQVAVEVVERFPAADVDDRHPLQCLDLVGGQQVRHRKFLEG